MGPSPSRIRARSTALRDPRCGASSDTTPESCPSHRVFSSASSCSVVRCYPIDRFGSSPFWRSSSSSAVSIAAVMIFSWVCIGDSAVCGGGCAVLVVLMCGCRLLVLPCISSAFLVRRFARRRVRGWVFLLFLVSL